MRGLGVALVVAVLIPAQGILAQGNVPRTSRIVGIVIDSIHRTGLEGAEVMVSGMSSTVITDSLGRFTIDSLAPGTYQIGVFHPLLETLGLTLTTKPFTVGRDSTGVANLAIPSVETLASRYCGTPARGQHQAVVAGRVLDADTDQPVRAAAVSLAWVDVVVSKETGVVRTPHKLEAPSDSTGFFKFCGLPDDLDATVQAGYSGSFTGEVAVSTHDSPLTFENLALPAFTPTTAKGIVRGAVVGLDGNPISGARVEAPMWGVAALTRADGSFNLDAVPTGTQLLIVRHLGFDATRVTVNVTRRQPVELRVTLGPSVNVLDPVLVTARRNYALDKDGFTARRRTGWGTYFTSTDIEKRNPQYLSDMLTAVPGIQVNHRPGGATISTTQLNTILGGGRPSSCPTFWVDGTQWRSVEPGDIDQFVSPREVAGLEVYKPREAPVQFRTIDDCVTIVVWTQPPTPVAQ
ncbi:MAG TPA: carboxypeptidase regulatory-like domain-containing protein [Gemmatimonadaceae bacterium]|nr:carboxypeptidase regulatory-like domain-containing protein [Gemmatimonadaceae bacterium]